MSQISYLAFIIIISSSSSSGSSSFITIIITIILQNCYVWTAGYNMYMCMLGIQMQTKINNEMSNKFI